ncbi:MAG: protein YgfX [Panacagrimonas sp.]
MSSSSFVSTIELRLRPSARAHRLLFWLHGIPLALLPVAVPSGLWMLLPVVSIGASWWWLRRHPAFGHGPDSIRRLVWHADGNWKIRTASGTESAAALLPSSYLHDAVLILNFKQDDGRRRTRIVLGDEAEAALIQRLRARLSVSRPAASGSTR